MEPHKRAYDIVILGANGFTAGFVAEHIVSHFRSTLRWAIAGRNPSKLDSLRQRLRKLNPNGALPDVERIDLVADELDLLARNTRVLINAVGPYSSHGAPVVEACAKNGTSYVDFSTETPWIREMIEKYHDLAKENRARIVPAIGNSSSPSTLTSYLLAKRYLEVNKVAAEEIACSYNLKINGMSAGSLASVVEVVSRYGISALMFPDPYRLIPQGKESRTRPTRPFLGHQNDASLGHLATSFAAPGNEAVVYRSQCLQPSIYGQGLTYREYMPAASTSQAVLIHVVTKFAIVLLGLWPFRALLKYLKPESGTGPSKEAAQDEKIEVRSIARRYGSKVVLKVEYCFQGSMYYHSALLAAEASLVLLDLWDSQQESNPKGDEAFGILTPGSLGMPFVERLRDVGVKIELSEWA